MPGHRQSALLLYGLDKADQRWVLAQLGERDAVVLRRHLAELRTLGIPADPALAARAMPAGVDGAGATLHAASVAQVQLLLDEEPAWLTAHLLAAADWPWAGDFLAALTPVQRERIDALQATPLRPAAARNLVARAAQALAAQRGPAPAANRAGRAARVVLHQAVGRWF
jgi:hypothetical protein